MPKEVSMNWEKLAEGHEVLRVWRQLPPQGTEPEVAILRLSEEKYRKLLASPKEFVNNPQVFDKPVNSMDVHTEAVGFVGDKATRLLVVMHRPNSTASAVAAVAGDVSVAA